MPRILVRPSGPLSGEVRVSGAKNSALKLMAASTMVEGTTVLRNVPAISDVDDMAALLTAMGVVVERPEPGVLSLTNAGTLAPEAPYELVEKMRASTAVLGPMLARYGRVRVALPGGDDFGARPIDMHLRSFEAMGAHVEQSHGVVEVTAEKLLGAEIVLEFPSVGATENALMAAALAKGTTVIDNAAREPEIADLAEMLNRMGAQVLGAGGPTITVEGVDDLHPVDHTVIPDRIEAATFLACVGSAGGEVAVRGANPEHGALLFQKLGEMGLRISPERDGLWAMAPERLRSVDVATLPYPGIATDYKPLLVALLAVADGVGIVTENLFSGRFRYVGELVRMGADIRVEQHHAVIRGSDRLEGCPVRAPDIRAGAALVIAALSAEGETVIGDAHHLDRGYEDLVPKLQGLGADVERIED
jgi:UDP-N-acetylglucosamine 1-carboxyvinyltransferase